MLKYNPPFLVCFSEKDLIVAASLKIGFLIKIQRIC